MASASLDVPPRSRSAGEATKQVAPEKFNKPGYGNAQQQKYDKSNSYHIYLEYNYHITNYRVCHLSSMLFNSCFPIMLSDQKK